MDVIALSVSCKPLYNWVLCHMPPSLGFQIYPSIPSMVIVVGVSWSSDGTEGAGG